MKNFFEIYFEIEKNCSLNCKHCSSYSLRMHQKLNYTLEDAIALISLLDTSTYIYLTGGEPLINKNLYNIIKSLKKHKSSLNVGLLTSGVVTSNNILSSISIEEANKLKLAGLNNVYISIYHYKPELHDYITNQDMSFEYTKNSIANFKKVGVEVKIHLVLTKQNINSLEEIITFLANLRVSEVRLLRLVHNGSALLNWSEIGIPYKMQNKAIHYFFNKRNELPIKITISGFPDLMACRPFNNACRCQAGTNVLYVTLEGEVYPCACTKDCSRFRIGHISEINKISKYICDNKIEYNVCCLNPLTEEEYS